MVFKRAATEQGGQSLRFDRYETGKGQSPLFLIIEGGILRRDMGTAGFSYVCEGL